MNAMNTTLKQGWGREDRKRCHCLRLINLEATWLFEICLLEPGMLRWRGAARRDSVGSA
jgi:hypothetical protein